MYGQLDCILINLILCVLINLYINAAVDAALTDLIKYVYYLFLYSSVNYSNMALLGEGD